MSYQLNAKLGAGSVLKYEDPAVPGVYVSLTTATDIGGQTGSQGEFVETTPIASTTREYIRGMKTPPDKQFTFNHQPGNAAYKRFLDVVDNQSYDFIKMRVEYTSGDRADFNIVANGRVMEPADGGSQLKHLVFGKQTGDVAWSEF
jgi:hypothetical protein